MNKAVESFGFTLRLSISQYDDYASLVELGYAEKPEEFISTLRSFLRRWEANARSYEKETGNLAHRPSHQELDEIIKLVETYGTGIVSSALVSHALVKGGQE